MRRILRHVALVLALAAALAAGATGVLRAEFTPPCAMMDHGDDGAPCTPTACPAALCAVTPFAPPALTSAPLVFMPAEARFVMPADLAVTGEHPPPPHKPPIA